MVNDNNEPCCKCKKQAEQTREYKRRHYAENAEHIRQYMRNYYAENKDKYKKYVKVKDGVQIYDEIGCAICLKTIQKRNFDKHINSMSHKKIVELLESQSEPEIDEQINKLRDHVRCEICKISMLRQNYERHILLNKKHLRLKEASL